MRKTFADWGKLKWSKELHSSCTVITTSTIAMAAAAAHFSLSGSRGSSQTLLFLLGGRFAVLTAWLEVTERAGLTKILALVVRFVSPFKICMHGISSGPDIFVGMVVSHHCLDRKRCSFCLVQTTHKISWQLMSAEAWQWRCGQHVSWTTKKCKLQKFILRDFYEILHLRKFPAIQYLSAKWILHT